MPQKQQMGIHLSWHETEENKGAADAGGGSRKNKTQNEEGVKVSSLNYLI